MNSLIKRLKSGNRDVRCSAIDELAELRTKEAVSLLKRVAEGRRRSWLSWYDFNDQVYVLRKLSDIRQEDINDYLRTFFREETKYVHSWVTSDPTRNIPTWGEDLHNFPNASGKLGKRLSYTSDVHAYRGGTAMPEEGVPGKPVIRDEEAHKIREEILQKIGD